MDDFLSFMNNQRNQLIEKKLIDFRLELTLTDLGINDILMIKVNCDPEDNKVLQLIDKISIFSWIAFYVAHDCIIIQILGINKEHAITNIIIRTVESIRVGKCMHIFKPIITNAAKHLNAVGL